MSSTTNRLSLPMPRWPLLRSGRARASYATIVVLMSFFYAWTTYSAGPAEIGGPKGTLYSELATSLLQGRLDVDPQTPEGKEQLARLLELPNPYDPVANADLRPHDASLFDGHLYMYFGVTPAVVFIAPARLIGVELDAQATALILAIGTYVIATLLLALLLGQYAPNAPPWIGWVGIVAIGLTNVVPYVLRRPAMYEIAILSGLLFTTLAILLALLARREGSRSTLLWAGSGTAAILAVGSRPHLIVIALVPVVLLLVQHRRAPRAGRRDALAFAAPVAIGLALLGLYNWARFGSFVEFGTRYQLTDFDMTRYDRFDAARILPEAVYYFLLPPNLSTTFPFVVFAPEWPWGTAPSAVLGRPDAAGFLAIAPIAALGIAGIGVLAVRRLRGLSARFLLVGALLIGAALLCAAIQMSVFGTVTQRYEADWATLLLLVGFTVAAIAARHVRTWRAPVRVTAITVIAVASAYGAAIGVAASLTGPGNGLRAGNPQAWRALEDFFGLVPALDARLSGAPVLQGAGQPTPVSMDFQIAAWDAGPLTLTAGPLADGEPLPATKESIINKTTGRSGIVTANPDGTVAATVQVIRGVNRITWHTGLALEPRGVAIKP